MRVVNKKIRMEIDLGDCDTDNFILVIKEIKEEVFSKRVDTLSFYVRGELV